MQDIPLALLSLARSLPADNPAIIIDQRLPGWKNKLLDALKAGPLCIGFSVKTGEQIRYALDISSLVRKYTRAPIVWGGVHPSLMPRQTIEHPLIDFLVQGEGERSFALLVQSLAAGTAPTGIAGVWHKAQGVIAGCPPDETPLDLNTLPLLPYQLIDFSAYPMYRPGKAGRNFPVETGRGCIHHCSFCYHSAAQRRERRTLSADSIITHIRHLRQHTAVDALSFVDDSFLTEKDRLFTFAALMREHMNGIKWSCEANASDILRLSDEELGQLKASGLTWLAVGAESGSDRILRQLGKDITSAQLRIVHRRLKNTGFLVRYNFMSGYISETDEELRQTTDLMMEMLHSGTNVSVQSLRISIPYPSTRYYHMAIAQGMKEPHNLQDWQEFSIEQCTPLPWIDKRKQQLLVMLYITSFFLDSKPIFKRTFSGHILRKLSHLYRLLALFRFEHHFIMFPFELPLYRWFQKMINSRETKNQE